MENWYSQDKKTGMRAAEPHQAKSLDERNIAAELVSELMDLKIGLTNRRVIQELKEERKKLDLLIKRGDREAEV